MTYTIKHVLWGAGQLPPTHFFQLYFGGFMLFYALVRLVVYFPCFRFEFYVISFLLVLYSDTPYSIESVDWV
jgi:hypothetical protein